MRNEISIKTVKHCVGELDRIQQAFFFEAAQVRNEQDAIASIRKYGAAAAHHAMEAGKYIDDEGLKGDRRIKSFDYLPRTHNHDWIDADSRTWMTMRTYWCAHVDCPTISTLADNSYPLVQKPANIGDWRRELRNHGESVGRIAQRCRDWLESSNQADASPPVHERFYIPSEAEAVETAHQLGEFHECQTQLLREVMRANAASQLDPDPAKDAIKRLARVMKGDPLPQKEYPKFNRSAIDSLLRLGQILSVKAELWGFDAGPIHRYLNKPDLIDSPEGDNDLETLFDQFDTRLEVAEKSRDQSRAARPNEESDTGADRAVCKLSIDEAAYRITYMGKALQLNEQTEYKVCAELVRHFGEIVKHADLYRAARPNQVHAGVIQDTAAPEVKDAITSIRTAFYKVNAPYSVSPVRRIGYRLHPSAQ